MDPWQLPDIVCQQPIRPYGLWLYLILADTASNCPVRRELRKRIDTAAPLGRHPREEPSAEKLSAISLFVDALIWFVESLFVLTANSGIFPLSGEFHYDGGQRRRRRYLNTEH